MYVFLAFSDSNHIWWPRTRCGLVDVPNRAPTASAGSRKTPHVWCSDFGMFGCLLSRTFLFGCPSSCRFAHLSSIFVVQLHCDETLPKPHICDSLKELVIFLPPCFLNGFALVHLGSIHHWARLRQHGDGRALASTNPSRMSCPMKLERTLAQVHCPRPESWLPLFRIG